MSDSYTQNSEDFKDWSYLITKAITRAIADIVPASGQQISIDSIKVGKINTIDVPELLGGPESLVIGSYSALSGTINGHIMIVHRPDLALRIMNINPERLSTLNEKEQCTLSEIENRMRNGFLSAMKDMLAVSLHPFSSAVLVDKAAALLNIALTEFLHENDSIFITEAMIAINGQTIQSLFIIMMDHIFTQLAQNLTVRV